VIRRLFALAAVVIATALIASVAVADKRRKTEALRRAHLVSWLCNHGRGGCGERSDQRRRAEIESDWNYRERYYVAGVALCVVAGVALVALELRSRRRTAEQLF
jgi:hypothetical protein